MSIGMKRSCKMEEEIIKKFLAINTKNCTPTEGKYAAKDKSFSILHSLPDSESFCCVFTILYSFIYWKLQHDNVLFRNSGTAPPPLRIFARRIPPPVLREDSRHLRLQVFFRCFPRRVSPPIPRA